MEENEKEEMVATRWPGLEISLVSVASDPHVGIGRSHPTYSTPKEEKQMSHYVTDYMKPQVEEADFDHECRQFSIIEAAKVYVTLGEIVTAMKAEFGEWQEAAVF